MLRSVKRNGLDSTLEAMEVVIAGDADLETALLRVEKTAKWSQKMEDPAFAEANHIVNILNKHAGVRYRSDVLRRVVNAIKAGADPDELKSEAYLASSEWRFKEDSLDPWVAL